MTYALALLAVFAIGIWTGWHTHQPPKPFYVRDGTSSLTTQEVIGQLRKLDPSGLRQVYITAWLSDDDPITDHATTVYLDDEGDVIVSGAEHDDLAPPTE